MAVEYVGVAEVGFGTRTSMKLTEAELKAAGFTSGHLLTLFPVLEAAKKLACTQTTNTINPEQKESGARTAPFWLIWGGSGGLEVTWEGNGSFGGYMEVFGWKGMDTTTPIDMTGVWATVASANKGTAATASTVTANALQVIFFSVTSAAELSKVPTGFAHPAFGALTRLRPTPEPTGTTVLELTGVTSGVILNFAIRPKSEEPTAQPVLSMVI